MKSFHEPLFKLSVLSLILFNGYVYAADEEDNSQELQNINVTAERQLQQSLGVSRIKSEDLAKRPVANDISEFVRTMPGVNLTGNTASGTRGNKRQIDIRGMGPENTLILIDGKPVTSRNNERVSRSGERNTRGDSNWVPAEAIDRIQVLRGPAAARYGSGAMGGVVNIITKKNTNTFQGSVTYYTNQPQDNQEGATNRVGFNISGPIIQDILSYRLYGSVNKTDADANDINQGYNQYAAGVEGVRNKDIAGRLYWQMSPNQSLTWDASFSRQGNIYNGDTLYSVSTANSAGRGTRYLLGQETARLYRSATSLTHDGAWSWGETKTYISFDNSKNSRYPEALTGGIEGSYDRNATFTDSVLKNYHFNHESYIPFNTGNAKHVATVGLDALHSKLDDTASMSQGFSDVQRGRVLNFGTYNGMGNNRSGITSQSEYALYFEDNIVFGQHNETKLIPMLRLDYSTKFGKNWSPALNFSHNLSPSWVVKGGIARAYKAPNLYQSNDNYFLFSRGIGCHQTGANCFLQGNSDLKPETSWNKELGFEFNQQGYQVSLAYFHNDYRNKITEGTSIVGRTTNGNAVFRWQNAHRAVVEGVEGSVILQLIRDQLRWTNNFTVMRRSLNKDTGEALSLIPKYTINSTLNWTPNERWDANLSYTYFGKQNASLTYLEQNSASATERQAVPRYGLLGVNAGYKFNKHLDVRAGVSNVFNKKIYRSGNGANSYNEHGRAYYASIKVSF